MAYRINCPCGAYVLLTELVPQVRCGGCGELYSTSVYDASGADGTDGEENESD